MVTGAKKEEHYPSRRGFGEMVPRPFHHCWATALDRVNLEVREAEVLGLLGPHGAEKIALLEILAIRRAVTEGTADSL